MKTKRLCQVNWLVINLLIFMIFSNVPIVMSQTLTSAKSLAWGDDPNISMTNSSASSTTNDKRAGIWLDNDGKLKLRNVSGYGFAFRNASNVADLAVLTNDGNIGLGMVNPAYKLQLVDGTYIALGNYSNSNAPKGILFTGFRDTAPNYFGASIEAVPNWYCCGGFPNGGYAGIKAIDLQFLVHGSDVNSATNKIVALTLKSTSGNVGIGTTTPTEKLAVNGNIKAKEIRVTTASQDWPDYVFEDHYQLTSLSDLASYIKIHKHLPDMPDQKQVEVDGISLGEMNKKLLEKVEELTLHLIEKEKEINKLSSKVDYLTESLLEIENTQNKK